MPAILLVRHAQASFGAADYDVISERGSQQVTALADDLARREVRPSRVLSGTPRRQLDTAGPIAAAAGLTVEVDAGWDEYVSDDILAHHSLTPVSLDRPPDANGPAVSSRSFQELLDGALEGWIAAGTDGFTTESWPHFVDRVSGALERLTASLGSGEIALVSTSGGPLAAVCVALLGAPATVFPRFNRVAVNTGVTRLVHGRSGTTLVAFNEHAHLEHAGGSLITYR